ncbi:death-associated protein 1-like [Homarus americanus]|uniref:Death-associated protein 1-like n=1 Tax=Homarus americanus TaxID=6706 RepID=A0A8J5MRM8_HOMAM|nr:death-associated protein 1-like [Homarus americanus]KAG7160986.1 Death-associated protein 1-like [Homarus americanus]
MSSAEEIEAKAGHPPAMKVGGVRIPQRRRSAEEKEGTPPKPRKDSEDGEEDETLVAKSPPRAPVVVSGVVGKVERDFPTAAVKHTHEKPVPTHDERAGYNTKPPFIQQPRK